MRRSRGFSSDTASLNNLGNTITELKRGIDVGRVNENGADDEDDVIEDDKDDNDDDDDDDDDENNSDNSDEDGGGGGGGGNDDKFSIERYIETLCSTPSDGERV